MNRRGFFAGLGAAVATLAGADKLADVVKSKTTLTDQWRAVYLKSQHPVYPVYVSDKYLDSDQAMLDRFYAKWSKNFRDSCDPGRPLIIGPGVEIKSLDVRPREERYHA